MLGTSHVERSFDFDTKMLKLCFGVKFSFLSWPRVYQEIPLSELFDDLHINS